MKIADSNSPRKPSPRQELEQARNELWEKRKHAMPKEHARLYEMLKHKHPKDMAVLIADAFSEQYPTFPNIRTRVLLHLYPKATKKQPISFSFLHKQISSLGVWFNADSPCIELIDSLRYIFQLLPGPANPYREERTSRYDDSAFSSKEIVLQQCRSCWHTVWRYPVENGMPKCSNHTFKSDSKEYKHFRIIRKKYSSCLATIRSHCQQLQQKMQEENGHEILPDTFAVHLCLLLPRVSALIDKELARNPNYDKIIFENDMIDFLTPHENFDLLRVPWEQHHKYMQNHPHPGARFVRTVLDILDPHDELIGNLALAREQFVMNMTWGFAAYIPYLFEAEAWMMAEELSQHGGKRQGAGRKPSRPKRRLPSWVPKKLENFYCCWKKLLQL